MDELKGVMPSKLNGTRNCQRNIGIHKMPLERLIMNIRQIDGNRNIDSTLRVKPFCLPC